MAIAITQVGTSTLDESGVIPGNGADVLFAARFITDTGPGSVSGRIRVKRPPQHYH